MPSSPGSMGLARAHPLTKSQATEPSRQTWSRYGPPYPLGRWSSGFAASPLLFLPPILRDCHDFQSAKRHVASYEFGKGQMRPTHVSIIGRVHTSDRSDRSRSRSDISPSRRSSRSYPAVMIYLAGSAYVVHWSNQPRKNVCY